MTGAPLSPLRTLLLSLSLLSLFAQPLLQPVSACNAGEQGCWPCGWNPFPGCERCEWGFYCPAAT